MSVKLVIKTFIGLNSSMRVEFFGKIVNYTPIIFRGIHDSSHILVSLYETLYKTNTANTTTILTHPIVTNWKRGIN